MRSPKDERRLRAEIPISSTKPESRAGGGGVSRQIRTKIVQPVESTGFMQLCPRMTRGRCMVSPYWYAWLTH